MDNQAITHFSYCPGLASLPNQPHCTNAKEILTAFIIIIIKCTFIKRTIITNP